jgi:hypothetical protein
MVQMKAIVLILSISFRKKASILDHILCKSKENHQQAVLNYYISIQMLKYQVV